MSLLKTEPFVVVESMEELLAIACAMEQEAIASYTELADRMRREDKPELAAVFDRLVDEENRHLGNVEHWSGRIAGKQPELSTVRGGATETFDDEGTGTIAPALLSAYRAFSMAVRNEERAFVFWTYVAARAPSDGLREAAEQMAREELGHVATLRRERRRAFHQQRTASTPREDVWNLAALELRLSDQIEAAAVSTTDHEAAQLRELARQARDRADSLARSPLGDSPLLRNASAEAAIRMASLCELLLDCYLDLANRLPDEMERNRAQELAAGAVHCLSVIR